MEIDPPWPEVAAPEPMYKAPLFKVLPVAEPVLKITRPLDPPEPLV